MTPDSKVLVSESSRFVYFGRFLEQALAASEKDRKDHDPVLVDHIAPDEGVEESAAAVQEDVPAGFLFRSVIAATGSPLTIVVFRHEGLSKVVETTYFGMSFMRSVNPSSFGAVGQNAAKIS